jgi:23S rRNA pseudouridine1911/1915/1917 synthase
MAHKPRISLIHLDSSILVVSKPSGLATIPEGYDAQAPDLAALLRAEYGDLWVVHRLDRDTSGVLVLARTESAHRLLNDQFESRQVSKVYHALVKGHPAWNDTVVSAPLLVDADRHHRTMVDQHNGKPAVTSFRVLERFGRGGRRWALVEARPETGRTHQIRVHLMTLGNPVAVDALYGTKQPILLSSFKQDYRGNPEDELPLLSRLALHACQLTFTHPETGESVTYEAPYLKDIGATLNQLRRHARA